MPWGKLRFSIWPMSQVKAFPSVKYVSGIIYFQEHVLAQARRELEKLLGPVEDSSPAFTFDQTDYYNREMGGEQLFRIFLSFGGLRSPEELSAIKLRTNALEAEIRSAGNASRRPINIDPGYLTAAALVMATAKDFSHRIPLRDGIYAHLELMFTKHGVRCLEWTYPDFRKPDYHEFFLRVRKAYLAQLKELKS